MNFTANAKRAILMVAVAASLLLAARANSQEIVNTDFQTPANSAGGNFNVPTPTALNTAAVTPQPAYNPAVGLMIRTSNNLDQVNAASLSRESELAISMVVASYAAVKMVSSYIRTELTNTWNRRSPQDQPLISRHYVLHG